MWHRPGPEHTLCKRKISPLSTQLPLHILLTTHPATDPYPPQHRTRFKAFCLAIGVAGGLALGLAITSGVPGFRVTLSLEELRGLGRVCKL